MPIVEVKMLSGRSVQQKKEIARQITEIMTNVAGARKEAVIVNIQEFSPENYAVGGEMMADKMK